MHLSRAVTALPWRDTALIDVATSAAGAAQLTQLLQSAATCWGGGGLLCTWGTATVAKGGAPARQWQLLVKLD
jgi:hypothetical protein